MIDLSGCYTALIAELAGAKPTGYNLTASAAYRVRAWDAAYFQDTPLVYLVRPGHAAISMQGADQVDVQREIFVLGAARFDRATELPWEIQGDTRWDVQDKLFADICRAIARTAAAQHLPITTTDVDFWPDEAPWACIEVRAVIALDTTLAGLC